MRIGLIGYDTADKVIKFFPLSTDLDKVYENLSTDQSFDAAVRRTIQEQAAKQLNK